MPTALSFGMLSPYATCTLRVLLDALPDLTGHVSEQEEFIINFSSPAGWDFSIASEDEHLTVEFAEFHCHFGGYADDTPESDALNAVALIKELRSHQVLLAVWYQGDKYSNSSIVGATEEPQQLMFGKNIRLELKRW